LFLLLVRRMRETCLRTQRERFVMMGHPAKKPTPLAMDSVRVVMVTDPAVMITRATISLLTINLIMHSVYSILPPLSLSVGVNFIHTYLNFSDITVASNYTNTHQQEHTCIGALGDSFAAGTTDGPGDFNFVQDCNVSTCNPYWNLLASFLSDPTPEQIACQVPKPILLNTGAIHFPAPWTPVILPLQIFRLGQLFIIGVPGEFTTMSGRRLRDSVKKTLMSYGAPNDTIVVIAGLSNEYSHYITTYEEFQYQRYEGASTLFGPNTLAAYQQEYDILASSMMANKAVPVGPIPFNYINSTINLLPPVVVDTVPTRKNFGDVETDVFLSYARGSLVQVSFWGGNPRNDFRIQDTFLTVEKKIATGVFNVVLVDGDWETKYHWEKIDETQSLINIYWQTESTTAPGTYRIQHFGNWKDDNGTISPYSGVSSTFVVNS